MQLLDTAYIYYILRIVIASVCGLFIGLERKNRSKEAGMRTHCIVACGAALMMIVSKYAFFDLIKADSFVLITLGTGVGGGVIIDGKPYRGFNCAGGELGHIIINADGEEQCSCGNKGCWEAYASVTALIRQTKQEMQAATLFNDAGIIGAALSAKG